jgi:hypothetical protein
MTAQEHAIAAGNVVRTTWPVSGAPLLPLYQGSGRSGACWNAWGLMGPVDDADPQALPCVWSHADYWHRGPFGLDAWLQVGRVEWAHLPPAAPRDYRQELDLPTGQLTTTVDGPEGRYVIRSWFDPARPDILALEITTDFPGAFPPLLFSPILEQDRGYSGPLRGEFTAGEDGPLGRALRLRTGTAEAIVLLRVHDFEGHSTLVSESRGVRLELSPRGRHLVLLGAASPAREAELRAELDAVEPAGLSLAAARNWKQRWGHGWISVPDGNAQALWARSHFYILSSYNADVRAPAPPTGWTGTKWPYGFPQDLSYIHPALLRLGHLDIARAWVEFYARTIPSMREATARIYGTKGTMWAWEYPIGESSRILPDGSPNLYQHEIHNAAYPARMAYETVLHVSDAAWARAFAWPVVQESARFFASALRRAPDGLWDLRVTPSMGQDELDLAAGEGNFLCSLFSARYALQAGVDLARRLGTEDDECARWGAILKDGLAFPRLLDAATGLYATREGIDAASHLGQQKHPIQLNPFFCVPLGAPDAPTREAVRRRRDLCIGVGQEAPQGWTPHALCLAAVHAGDAEGFRHDLLLAGSDRAVDAEWLQIYECAPEQGPYFVTSHGLYLQAMQDALVSDFTGEPVFGAACPAEWREVAFGGLCTRGGASWSGVRTETGWKIERE